MVCIWTWLTGQLQGSPRDRKGSGQGWLGENGITEHKSS